MFVSPRCKAHGGSQFEKTKSRRSTLASQTVIARCSRSFQAILGAEERFLREGLLRALCHSNSGRPCTSAAAAVAWWYACPRVTWAVSLPGSCSQALAITTARGVLAVGGGARVAEGERVAARAWDTLESLGRGVGRYRA